MMPSPDLLSFFEFVRDAPSLNEVHLPRVSILNQEEVDERKDKLIQKGEEE